jgi:hypothetical protein
MYPNPPWLLCPSLDCDLSPLPSFQNGKHPTSTQAEGGTATVVRVFKISPRSRTQT